MSSISPGALPEAASVHRVWRPLPSAGGFPGVVWHQRPHPLQLTASSTSASTRCHHTGQFPSTPQRVRDRRELQVLQLVGPVTEITRKSQKSVQTHPPKQETHHPAEEKRTVPRLAGEDDGCRCRVSRKARRSGVGPSLTALPAHCGSH